MVLADFDRELERLVQRALDAGLGEHEIGASLVAQLDELGFVKMDEARAEILGRLEEMLDGGDG